MCGDFWLKSIVSSTFIFLRWNHDMTIRSDPIRSIFPIRSTRIVTWQKIDPLPIRSVRSFVTRQKELKRIGEDRDAKKGNWAGLCAITSQEICLYRIFFIFNQVVKFREKIYSKVRNIRNRFFRYDSRWNESIHAKNRRERIDSIFSIFWSRRIDLLEDRSKNRHHYIQDCQVGMSILGIEHRA